MSRPLVIAVDGPAASGKGTIAAGLARDYGLPHLDTGLLYRAVGVLMARAGRDLSDEAAAAAQARTLTADVLADPGFRTRAAGEAASRVAVYPQVREALLAFQRAFAVQPGGAILDGRDIGTVVFPDAPYKFYIDASEEVRLSRRGLQGQADAVRERDRMDSTRKVAPLIAASDAIIIDSSEMTLDQVVANVMEILQERGLTTPAAL
jgi:cytidylate kinase